MRKGIMRKSRFSNLALIFLYADVMDGYKLLPMIRTILHDETHYDIERLVRDDDGNQVWAVIFCIDGGHMRRSAVGVMNGNFRAGYYLDKNKEESGGEDFRKQLERNKPIIDMFWTLGTFEEMERWINEDFKTNGAFGSIDRMIDFILAQLGYDPQAYQQYIVDFYQTKEEEDWTRQTNELRSGG